MEIDITDRQILEEILETPGQAARFYADRVWIMHKSLTRGGCEYRIDKMRAAGLISVERVHQRLNAVNLTDEGRKVLAEVQA